MPSPAPAPGAPSPDWEAFYRDYRKPGYVDGFEITSKLGGGMFGHVFRARRLSIGKDYAIKFLKVEDENVRRAVLAELEQVHYFAQIDHPNLVAIEDRGEVDGIPFLVMAFAGTETLRDWMPPGRPPSDEEKEPLMRAFLQAARGLQALHDRSLVHFDVKPANVFLKGGVARLGDYGLSKLVTHSRGSLSMGRGTPYYMAPEMLQRKGDHRSDIYSLGVMLYELLTGAVPFTGDSEWEVLRQHETAAPVLPDHLSRREREVLSRCLAKEPAARFGTVHELLDALQTGSSPAAPAPAAPAQRAGAPQSGPRASSAVPPLLPGERVGKRGLKIAPPNSAMPPLPRRPARPARRRGRGGTSPWVYVGLFAAAVVLVSVYALSAVRVRMSEGVRISQVYRGPSEDYVAREGAEAGTVEGIVEDRLKRGRVASQQNRPTTLRPLDLDKVDAPPDLRRYEAVLAPLLESPRFVPALARRIESYGRPASLCAVALLQRLDYDDGLECRQASNLLRFLEQATGVGSLVVEVAGYEPSARETCMYAAVADAWREIVERFAATDTDYYGLLAERGRQPAAREQDGR